MPQINIHGASSRFGTRQQWEMAHYENRNLDEQARHSRRMADYQNQQMDAANRELRQVADYFNRVFDDAARKLRGAADYENNQFESRIRKQRQEADYENRQFDARLRKEKREQDYRVREKERRLGLAGDFQFGAPSFAERQANQFGRTPTTPPPGFRARMAMGAARFVGGAEGERMLGRTMGYRGGGGGFGGLGVAGELGALGVGGYLAYRALKGVYNIPDMYSGLLNGLSGKAAPYTNLRLGAASIGRSGLFGGQGLANLLYPGGGATPAWMSRTGATPTSAMSALQAYGLPIDNPEMGKGIAKSIFSASMLPGMGGIGTDRLAQSLGLYRTLNPGFGNTTDMGAGGDSTNKYFDQLQKVLVNALPLGLDKAKVLNNIEDLFRLQTSLGIGVPNIGRTGNFFNRMAASGAPSARTGEAQMTMMQESAAMAQGAGFGGSAPMNVMLHSYMARNGGMPKNKAQLEKVLGVSYDSLPPNQQLLFNAALNASQTGNEAIFFDIIKKTWLSNPDTLQRIAQGSGMITGGLAMRTALGANLTTGGDYTTYSAYQAGKLPAVTTGGNTLGARLNNTMNLTYAAGQSNVMGTVSANGRKFDRFASPMYGVAGAANQLSIYQDKYGLKTVREMANRWVGGTGASASYINSVAAAMGVTPDTPIDIHNQGMAMAYIRAASMQESGVNLSQSDLSSGVSLGLGQNQLGNINPRIAAGGQAEMAASQKASDMGDLLIQTVGGPLASMGASITTAVHALDTFTIALGRSTGSMPGFGGGPRTGNINSLPALP